ncbi:MAG TPA: TIR domain-containing protein, partial [Solirubrobacteraceae bacterium]
MSEGAAGFWSYVQADDASDCGRIMSLSVHLRSQYRLQTAEELALFVDRESLEWGAEWESRIDDAIAGTTFFIPIITPSYFRSQACRRELSKFVREATRLGLEQLIMPVYWVTVPELEEDPDGSEDEAVRLVSTYQRQDLRAVRLEDEDSSVFRKAVSNLAAELAKRAVRITETVQDVPPTPAALSDDSASEDDELGLLDKIAVSEDAMPKLVEILEEVGVQIVRVGELVSAADASLNDAAARSQSTRARLVITEQLARDLIEPAGRLGDLGHEYGALLTTLDPGIHALLDVASESPRGADGRNELLESIQGLSVNADGALEQLEGLVDSTKGAARFSRSLRAPLRRMVMGLQGILDGRAIIEEWGHRAADIEAEDARHEDTATCDADDLDGSG